MSKIEPRLLKGFRDFLPSEVYARRKVMKVFQETFEKYGFQPLETPTLEYFDILMGKYGEEEKLVYNFKDHGDRHVAMKYDLTVPTSRVVAQYRNQINLPWKRYQIQPVWRADNTQKGRFREFWQCDADILGTSDMIADAEFITMGIEIMKKLGFEDFRIRINNRKILNAIAEYAGREDMFYEVVYAIDKWDKRTVEETIEDLKNRGFEQNEIDKIIQCVNPDFDDSITQLEELFEILKDTKDGKAGVIELKEIFELVENDYLQYDPTIARGLAYYTGPIWEFEVLEGGVGSVGGAGRYDELVGSFVGQDIPATGGSFGIERIIEVLKDRDRFETEEENLKVLVTVFDINFKKKSFEVAKKLWNEGIKSDIYSKIKNLGKQIDYANKIGAEYVIIFGEEEEKKGIYNLKNMKTGDQEELSLDEIIEKLK